MKIKTLILICSFVVIGFSIQAQQFNGGVMAGIAATQVAGDRYSGFKKPGIYAGGYVNLQVSPRSIFQMELEFFQKGSRKNPNYEQNDLDEYLFRVNYVELPVLYQFVINKRFKVEAGPSAGFLINRVEREQGEDITYFESYNEPARVTLQINVGIYITIAEGFMVNFRTNNSLLNIRSRNVTGDVWRLWGYGQFNDGLVFSLVYQFWNQGED